MQSRNRAISLLLIVSLTSATIACKRTVKSLASDPEPPVEVVGPDKFGLNEIIAGTWDAYIDKWGDAAREFGKPMIVVFGNEMNGDWFPWSGWFYGANKLIGTAPDR